MNKLFLCGALYKQNVFAIHSSESKSRNVNASESSLKIWSLELVSNLTAPFLILHL